MSRFFQLICARFIPLTPGKEPLPDELRRARMVIAFSALGVFFGTLFGGFYALIEHTWGFRIIALCSALFALMPLLLKSGFRSERVGNYFCLILLAGFTSLCWVEGGMNGHALAWLVTVPLCALLLTTLAAARLWAFATFFAAITIVGLELFGISPPMLYPAQWHVPISIMGYSALVVFMFVLGLVFEKQRLAAQRMMQNSLSALAESNKRLTRLNEEKSEFLGIAAHDLRSPLTVVMGCSEILAMDGIPRDRALTAAQSITREADRMRRLISDLLDLNAIEEGRTNLQIQPTSLADCLKPIWDQHLRNAEKKSISLEGAGWESPFLADPHATTQALDNLISNAIKFTKPGGRVRVDTSQESNHITIKVSDTGPGFTEEDRKKLFGRFAKLSARPTAGESSHGLGLSIVKRLIEAMGGQIQVTSQPGQGATFTLTFPMAQPNPQSVTASNSGKGKAFKTA